MNRYKVTAEPLKAPLYFQGESEDEAWDKAKKLSERNGTKLHNGKVEIVPTEAEKDARISALEAALKTAHDTVNEMAYIALDIDRNNDEKREAIKQEWEKYPIAKIEKLLEAK